MNNQTLAYLTVISWPSSFGEDERVATLVECAGMAPYQARLASRRNTPGIVRQLDAGYRDRVLRAMHDRGVLSIAPTQDELDAYPEGESALSVQQFPDADPPRFVVEPRQGEPWTFTSDQVWLVIVGRLRATSVSIEEPDRPKLHARTLESSVIHAATDDHRAYATRKIRIQPVIDLHVRSVHAPRLVRLIGPRTRIGIVGDTSRRSLLDDTKPIELIEAIMPGARIDREFLDFDPPPRLRSRATRHGGDSNIEKLEFWSFYSAWVGLMRSAMGD